MIQVIPSSARHHAHHGWLDSRFSFSFDQYYDPANQHFGPLRVFNDDRIAPASGFPTHPHREMEIVTYVLSGAIAHRDSTGGEGIIHARELQHMTAGRGIAHSEFNPSDDEPVHLLQMWIMPNERGLEPGYTQLQTDTRSQTNVLIPVVTPDGAPGTLRIHQNATFYVAHVEAGIELSHALAPNHLGYVFVIGGRMSVNGDTLSEGDTARIRETANLTLRAESATDLLLIDMQGM